MHYFQQKSRVMNYSISVEYLILLPEAGNSVNRILAPDKLQWWSQLNAQVMDIAPRTWLTKLSVQFYTWEVKSLFLLLLKKACGGYGLTSSIILFLSFCLKVFFQPNLLFRISSHMAFQPPGIWWAHLTLVQEDPTFPTFSMPFFEKVGRWLWL